MDDTLLNFDISTQTSSIIKVVGVGGGGGNAVKHMYKEGIHDVTFVLCNTDNQALLKSEIPVKLQLGPNITNGLGAGNRPEIAKKAAEESKQEIQSLLNDGTEMVFVTAGMGGGTGTGAAPVVAGIAKEMGILTIGIVTIPFLFEGEKKIIQALKGVVEMEKNVDALLVLNNQRLFDIYPSLTVFQAFGKADDTLTVAAKSIAETITLPGYINLDFADVKTVLKNGGVAIMSTGYGEGNNRISKAIDDALNSPLLNKNNVFNAKKILFNVSSSKDNELIVDEMNDIHNFMAKFSKNIEVIWGAAIDDELGDKVKFTVLATGFGKESIPMIEQIEELDQRENEKVERENTELIEEYYGSDVTRSIGKKKHPKPFIFTVEQLDNDADIELIINYPAYNRNSDVLNNLTTSVEN